MHKYSKCRSPGLWASGRLKKEEPKTGSVVVCVGCVLCVALVAQPAILGTVTLLLASLGKGLGGGGEVAALFSISDFVVVHNRISFSFVP